MNFIKLGVALFILLIIDFAAEYLIKQKVKDRRDSIKYRVAVRYVLFFCLLFTIAKIWVEGFGYVLGVMGIVAAALTITQKEYIMNIVGWLIIMWRDLFVEGDFVEIGRHQGYVRYMGMFYFFLEELFEGDKTGRFVKIPNSVVATQPVINFAFDRNFIEGRQYYIFSFDSSVSKIHKLMSHIEDELVKYLTELNEDRTHKQQREYEQHKKSSMQMQCILRVMQDREKTPGFQLKVRYYSLKQDQKKIGDKVVGLVLHALGPDLKLSDVGWAKQ